MAVVMSSLALHKSARLISSSTGLRLRRARVRLTPIVVPSLGRPSGFPLFPFQLGLPLR